MASAWSTTRTTGHHRGRHQHHPLRRNRAHRGAERRRLGHLRLRCGGWRHQLHHPAGIPGPHPGRFAVAADQSGGGQSYDLGATAGIGSLTEQGWNLFGSVAFAARLPCVPRTVRSRARPTSRSPATQPRSPFRPTTTRTGWIRPSTPAPGLQSATSFPATDGELQLQLRALYSTWYRSRISGALGQGLLRGQQRQHGLP